MLGSCGELGKRKHNSGTRSLGFPADLCTPNSTPVYVKVFLLYNYGNLGSCIFLHLYFWFGVKVPQFSGRDGRRDSNPRGGSVSGIVRVRSVVGRCSICGSGSWVEGGSCRDGLVGKWRLGRGSFGDKVLAGVVLFRL